MKFNSQAVSRKIGYQFTDQSLLERALTHRSYDGANNERLEFLGDAILNFVVAETLYLKFPQAREGELSRLRASLVKGETLALVARTLELGECLLLGEGELKSGGFRRASILSDAVEALIGAIYLDAGMTAAADRIRFWLAEKIANITLEDDARDPKSRLQEWLQAKRQPLPVYELVQSAGEAHNQTFTISCSVNLVSEATVATATSRKRAEKEAARAMLAKLEGKASHGR